jgi:hypothetical protein
MYALLAVGGLNFILTLVFKLLPAVGAMNYVMVPYALPEVSLVDANINRDPAIWVFRSDSPFWEMIASVLFLCVFYAQPVLIGVFIWSVGLSLREDPVTNQGKSATILALGIAFALLAFHLLTMTGTSSVALIVLRVIYALWLAFTILLLVRLPMAMQSARAILLKYLEGAEFKDEEDEDEDDEDEDDRPRRRRR